MKLGRIPFHKLHEVPRLRSKEYFVIILKFRREILAGEIVEQLDEYGHSLSEHWIWGCEKSRDRQLEEAKVRSEEFGVD
jgi:REP element-mobilizing transposase RayT